MSEEEDGYTTTSVQVIDPTSASAMAADVELTIGDHPTMVMHRQAVLVFENSAGKQFVIPLPATGAATVAHELQVAASEAANAFDDELEVIEITYSKTGEVE